MGLGPHSKYVITLIWYFVILIWDYNLQWDCDPILNYIIPCIWVLSFQDGGITIHNGIAPHFKLCHSTHLGCCYFDMGLQFAMQLGSHSKDIIPFFWYIVILTWDYDSHWDWDPIPKM